VTALAVVEPFDVVAAVRISAFVGQEQRWTSSLFRVLRTLRSSVVVTQLVELLERVPPPVRGRSGRPRQSPRTLIANGVATMTSTGDLLDPSRRVRRPFAGDLNHFEQHDLGAAQISTVTQLPSFNEVPNWKGLQASRQFCVCELSCAARTMPRLRSALAEPPLPAGSLRVMTLARQTLTDTLCQDILRCGCFRRTLGCLGDSRVQRVLRCAGFDVCHDGSAGSASAFSVAAAGAGTAVGLRGVTSRTSLV